MVISKKWPFRAAVGIILTVALVLVPGCGKDEQSISETVGESVKTDGDTVLYLNGSAVSAEEYGMLAKENSSQISMQYTTDQVNQEDFWETEIDGETPYSRLADLVEEQLKEYYALKELAAALGLTEDYTYEELMDSMKEENQERGESSGEEINYGLSSFDEASYYKYWYSNLETQVVDGLIQDSVKVSEKDCRNYYEENQEAYTYDVSVSILYGEISGDESGAWNTARQLSAALESGASTAEIEDVLGVSLEELDLNSADTQDGLSGVYANRWEIASGLQEGEVYGPYEDQGMFCVMKCTGRQENEQVSFDEVKDQIERYLQVQAAQEMIRERTAEMELEPGEISEKEVILQAVQ